MKLRAKLVLPLLLAAGLSACDGPEVATEQPPAPRGPEALHAHSAEFERAVIEVTEGVHVAVGYGLANSILIEGDDGVIIVDTLGGLEAAQEVNAAFREITDKPVKAIVYTHNHVDHVLGARAFAPDGGVPVYAHESTAKRIERVTNILFPAIYTRSMRMFGNFLPAGADGTINLGIGPFLDSGHGGGQPALLRPTHTVGDRLELTVAGVELEIVHAPGETDDQLFVWLPQRRVLLPGDNIYKAFPNLYTIRGTPYRDLEAWVDSLDRMRALEPEHLVPSHTRPISGREEVAEVLTVYRDAIQYVHDRTLRGINAGLTPDELVQAVRLPAELAEHPFLQEFYGKVEWSVRAIFQGQMGWFDGNPTNLHPTPPAERARRLVALAENALSIEQAARAALAEGDPQWAAELADLLIAAEHDAAAGRSIKAEALRQLGRAEANPNARHYYLTSALELDGDLVIVPPTPANAPTSTCWRSSRRPPSCGRYRPA